MKTFSTSGTGNQQTLSEIESNKIPIYDSVADVAADLSNLTVGQIVATKDTGEEIELKKQIKEIVSASTDFADFKTKIAEW
jgi:hypothetical protein